MESSKRTEAIDAISSPSNPAHWYAYASSAFLISLSLPLLLFPRLLLLLSTPRGAVGQPSQSSADQNAISAIGPDLTPLERYGSHSNAITMLALAALILVLSGAIPVTTAPMPDSSSAGKSPFRIPTVVVTALFFAAQAFTAWTQSGPRTQKDAQDPAKLGIGSFGKVVGLTHAAFAFWGFGVFMFGNDLTRNKKKAGDQGAKDKSVSSFPFKSEYNAKRRQREEEEEEEKLTRVSSKTDRPVRERGEGQKVELRRSPLIASWETMVLPQLTQPRSPLDQSVQAIRSTLSSQQCTNLGNHLHFDFCP